jgi:hypothetical protein
MNDRAKIVGGLTAFLVLVAFPIWHTVGLAGDVARPELELPEDSAQCVEDAQYMRAYHVDLLNQWRNAVVRDGEREHTSSSGKTYNMSLTGTCMECHSNRDTFCTRCHDYANVEPRCWSCHVEPEEG